MIITDGRLVIGGGRERAILAIWPTDHSGQHDWILKERLAALNRELDNMSSTTLQKEMAKRRAGQDLDLKTLYDPKLREWQFKGNSIALFVGMSSKIQFTTWPDILKKLEKVTLKLVPPSQWLRPKDNEYFGSCNRGMIYKQKTQ